MDFLASIRDGWGWCGIEPTRVVAQNAFGNVIVEDMAVHFWRICPEELQAERIADSHAALDKLRADPEFIEDWEMALVTQIAEGTFGLPDDGRCYCLKIPGVLGGEYEIDNIGTIARDELLGASGSMAQQIQDLPDGTQVELKVVK